MRLLKLTVATLAASSLLTACTTPGQSPTQLASNVINRANVTPTSHEQYPAKSPQHVAFYSPDNTPHSAYRVIGNASVSKYNLLGFQRQPEDMNRVMKGLAASIGGDGVIDVNTNQEKVEAKVIKFQKILI